jgi:hypothetical protein
VDSREGGQAGRQAGWLEECLMVWSGQDKLDAHDKDQGEHVWGSSSAIQHRGISICFLLHQNPALTCTSCATLQGACPSL